jgi:hypothetical protein
MARSEIIKSCPQHGTYLIAHKFERWETVVLWMVSSALT